MLLAVALEDSARSTGSVGLTIENAAARRRAHGLPLVRRQDRPSEPAPTPPRCGPCLVLAVKRSRPTTTQRWRRSGWPVLDSGQSSSAVAVLVAVAGRDLSTPTLKPELFFAARVRPTWASAPHTCRLGRLAVHAAERSFTALSSSCPCRRPAWASVDEPGAVETASRAQAQPIASPSGASASRELGRPTSGLYALRSVRSAESLASRPSGGLAARPLSALNTAHPARPTTR